MLDNLESQKQPHLSAAELDIGKFKGHFQAGARDTAYVSQEKLLASDQSMDSKSYLPWMLFVVFRIFFISFFVS